MERPFICGARLTAGNFYSSVLWYLSLSVPCSICAPSLFYLVLTLVSYCFTFSWPLHLLSFFAASLCWKPKQGKQNVNCRYHMQGSDKCQFSGPEKMIVGQRVVTASCF